MNHQTYAFGVAHKGNPYHKEGEISFLFLESSLDAAESYLLEFLKRADNWKQYKKDFLLMDPNGRGKGFGKHIRRLHLTVNDAPSLELERRPV